MDQRLIDYIKDGYAKGYSEAHLRDVLIRYGHSPRSVNNALDFVRFSTNSPSFMTRVPEEIHTKPVKPKKSSSGALAFVAIILVTLVVASVLVISVFNRQSDEITGLATQVQSEEAAKQQVVTSLEAQKSQIEQQISAINSLELSVAEKDRLLQEQYAKLDAVNAQIEKERQDTRDMLLEQTNAILKRNQ